MIPQRQTGPERSGQPAGNAARMFCALFPSDAHAPCRHPEGQEPAPYVKYVVKLKI